MTDFRDNARGILAMSLAMLGFILNDTFVKLASDTLPMGEILFLRGLIAVAMIGGVVVALGQLDHVRLLLHRTVLWRTVGEVGATLCYLTALFNMPIANSTTLMQTVPLVSTAVAAWIMREAVGWRRWVAIVIGFAGVVTVIRPGVAAFDAYSLLVLVAVTFVTLRDLVTRAMPSALPILLLTAATSAVVGLLGLTMGIWEDWLMPEPVVWLELIGSAICLTVAYYVIVVAMRSGDVSVVAPFRYVVIPMAILLGYLFWGDRPDEITLIGTAIIIATGIYTVHRETIIKRRRAEIHSPTVD